MVKGVMQAAAGSIAGRCTRTRNWLALPVLVALALCGCFGGGGPRPDPLSDMAWSFANDAVIIEIDAAVDLNQYDGQSHSLLMGVYQAASVQTFHDLAADPSALAVSLSTGKAPVGFSQFTRYVVTPGQHSYLIIDRAQNARNVILVAGYTQMSAATAVRQFDVPLAVTGKGWFSGKGTTAPGTLEVRLKLGAQGIINSQALASQSGDVDVRNSRQLEGGGKEILINGAK